MAFPAKRSPTNYNYVNETTFCHANSIGDVVCFSKNSV